MSDDKIEEIRVRHRYAYELPDDLATLLDEVDRLRADLNTQQGCCDGAAAQDSHIRQEREEHRAEVDRLRAANKELVAGIDNISRRNREEIAELREDNYHLRADRRERIATAAMQGMLASAELVAPPVHAGFIAKWAVVYADALIAKLDEEGKP